MSTCRLHPDVVSELYLAALASNLDRHGLVAGINPTFIAQQDAAPAPGPQIYSDLHAMNRINLLTDGTDPLRQWLLNAKTLAALRPESETFDACLASLGTVVRGSAARRSIGAKSNTEPTPRTRKTTKKAGSPKERGQPTPVSMGTKSSAEPKRMKRKVAVPPLNAARNAKEVGPKKTTPDSDLRVLFVEAVRPFHVMFFTQSAQDIDGLVEVTRLSGGGTTVDATGRRFAIKLLDAERKLETLDSTFATVTPSQIRYWFASTEPVLLVVRHFSTSALWWRWTDGELVAELAARDPAWFGRDSVLVRIPLANRAEGGGLDEIERYVSSATRTTGPLLFPGMYMRIHERAKGAAAELVSLSKATGFESVQKRLDDLERRLRSATYVVAIAGPARAGKSTLINALLNVEVSPTGKFPTTAVTILATAGERNETEILFADGRREIGPADASFLAQYATIDQNPDNARGVRLVNVRLVNRFLDLGISLLDAPGLHDPSEEIRRITDAALRTAHAVLYVLDVSSVGSGGFFVSAQVIDDLNRLRAIAERLFVVLNKDDALTPEDKDGVSEHVERTLRKYGVWEHLPQAPIFVSGRKAWLYRQDGSMGPSPIAELEAAVWSHLLNSNSTGWHRLRAAATELTRGARDFITLLQARRIDGAEAARLVQWFGTCKKTEQSLLDECRTRVHAECAAASERIDTLRKQILADLEVRLKGIALTTPLPSSNDLKSEIGPLLKDAFSSTWQQVTDGLEQFTAYVAREVEDTLQQARLVVGAPPGMGFVAMPPPDFGNTNELASPEAMKGLFWGGAIGLVLLEVLPIMPWLAIGGWFVGLAQGKEKQRGRAITKIISTTDGYMQSSIESFVDDIRVKLASFSEMLVHQVHDRMAVFVRDLQSQSSKLGTPLDHSDRAELEALEQKVGTTLRVLEDVVGEISAAQPHSFALAQQEAKVV